MPNYISINEINEGMILAESLLNNFGQTLMPAGATLTEKHKTMLKTWNISGILIKGANGDDDEIINPQLIATYKAKILERSNWSPKNKLEDEIFEVGAIKQIKFPKVK